jgi:hypothetical protein
MVRLRGKRKDAEEQEEEWNEGRREGKRRESRIWYSFRENAGLEIKYI